MSILHVEKKQKKLGEKKSTHLCIIIKIGLKYSIVVNQNERPFFSYLGQSDPLEHLAN